MLSDLNNTSENQIKFEPTMKVILRILNILLEKNSIGRTELSQITNLHYGRLTKHLQWLKNKSLIEFVIIDEKIAIKLTHNGRNFMKIFAEEKQ